MCYNIIVTHRNMFFRKDDYMYPQMPKLFPTLDFDGYQLTMIYRPSCNYNVWKNDEIIAKISVGFDCVLVNTGTELLYIPYDISVHVVECNPGVILPIEKMEKIILCAALFNH